MEARTNFRRFHDGGGDFLWVCGVLAFSCGVWIFGNARGIRRASGAGSHQLNEINYLPWL
jgi:hypothetical protein